MKLKPFNLEAALRGEPVCDCEYNPAVTVSHFPTAHPIYRVAVQWGNGLVLLYSEDGRKRMESTEPTLYMAPKKVTKWGRLLRNKDRTIIYTSNLAHDTRDEAEREPIPPLSELVTIFPIEFEE